MNKIEQIRERVVRYGQSFGDATMPDLLAIAIGQKAVDCLLKVVPIQQFEYGVGIESLRRMGVDEIAAINGIGKATAYKIGAVMEIVRRMQGFETPANSKISCAADAYQNMHIHLRGLEYEEFWVLLLNRSNEIMKKVKISQGGIAGTVADPKLIFSHALVAKACAIILVHNHPSGNKLPSAADLSLTRQVKDGGKLLDISVLDHVIYTDRGYYSFSDEGNI